MNILQTKSEMKRTGVYQIKNIITGKLYVGSTTQSFLGRLSTHIYHLKKNSHHSILLQRAYNKYGINNFEFSILEFCDSEIIVEREQYWLDKLKPYLSNRGYNILVRARNSEGFRQSEETLVLIGQLSKHKDNSKAVAAMRKANSGSKRDKAHSIRMSKLHSKPVIQLSLQGEFIKEWESGAKIREFYNLKPADSNISKCCSGKCKSYIGFMWVRKEDYNEKETYTYNPIINGIK